MLLATVAAALVMWEIGAPSIWGSPTRIIAIIWRWCVTGHIWPHAWSTVSVAVAGLVLGACVGVLLAYVAYIAREVGVILVPLMAWLNALPRILLVPLFIALIGIGLEAKLLMVVAMTTFPFFFNVLNGLRSINPRIVANAVLLGASKGDVMRYVHLPLLGNWVVASLRTALGFSMIGAVISEYMGAVSGLGYVVDMAYGLKRYDEAVAGLLVIFLVVGALDVGVRRIERAWSGTAPM